MANNVDNNTLKNSKENRNMAKTNKECKNYVHNSTKDDIVENNSSLNYIVAIGTSTGGPKALQNVIPLFPGNVPAAFLIVQHMPSGFTKSLSERLNNLSQIVVKEGTNDELIRPGHAYVAPGGFHMRVEGTTETSMRIKLSKDEPVSGHRPSVDVMMKSLSDTGFRNLIAVILTGMGDDGCEGIKKMKENNDAHVIAQDEKTCVVYGMPKAAVKSGVVDLVVPINRVADEILKIMEV